MERKSDGELAVRKRVYQYDMIKDTPLEVLILRDILPRSRRIIELAGFSYKPSSKHREDDLIEWFEYCRGGDLENAIPRRGRLSEDFLWHCFTQLAEALDVVHNRGSRAVVHRDVKPNNIFLETKYRPSAPWPELKLGDFGKADVKKHTEGLFVTRWQGPELPDLSAAGDVWGLGAVMHWLVHGRAPIAGRPGDFGGSQLEWEDSPRARKATPLPREYSDDLNRYVMACLEWNPEDRISSRTLLERLRSHRPRARR